MDSFTNHNFENRNEEYQEYPPNQKPTLNVFAVFARSLGIFSIFCAVFSIFAGAFICGGLAIILAILSKGTDSKMEKNAKLGFVTGIIGVTMQVSVLAVSVYNIIYVPEYREQFNSLYEEIYGIPMDDSVNDILDMLDSTNTGGEVL